MQIRESVENDKDAIRIVHQNAFGEPDGEAVSRLAIDLLEDKTAQPTLSLVAEQNNEIVGSIIYSSVKVSGSIKVRNFKIIIFYLQLSKYDNDILFFNSGDLYDGLTVNQLMSNSYESKTRNKLLALMFKGCGLVEKYSSGIDRKNVFVKRIALKSPAEELQKGFRVTLYKDTTE